MDSATKLRADYEARGLTFIGQSETLTREGRVAYQELDEKASKMGHPVLVIYRKQDGLTLVFVDESQPSTRSQFSKSPRTQKEAEAA